METSALIDEIIARVTKKVEVLEAGKKPKILILTDQHGTICHETLENERLTKKFQIDCALMMNYECDVNDYDAVIIYTLSNSNLSGLAGGLCGTSFLQIAMQAILMGKKVIIPQEAIELYAYKETAPAAYYSMLEGKLQQVQRFGVILCPHAKIEDALLGDGLIAECPAPQLENQQADQPKKEASLDKRIVTERDVVQAYADGAEILRIREKSILTDLAKDYIHAKQMELIRNL